MDSITKIKHISQQMYLEPAEEIGSTGRIPLKVHQPEVAPCGISLKDSKKHESLGVYDAKVGGGKPVKLLKTMLTTACERNCTYCPFRAGRSYRRVTFKPEEMADSFMKLNRAGTVEGLFLSSGIIKGGVTAQDKLLDTVDILRSKHQFDGFVHLKIMPGAEKAQVARAMQLADRLSVNLEAPTEDRLRVLAPMKQLVEELFRPLKWVEEIRRNQRPNSYNGRWPSTVTQFVVGAVGDTDVELLRATEYLYKKLRLRRSYFSAFRPIRDTPLENLSAENPVREQRLYQASFLLRDYGYGMEEFAFGQDGRLPLDVDPKMSWARAHLLHNPVEINKADERELLRIPGLGPISVKKIMRARRTGVLSELAHLRQLGVATKRLEPFVLMGGRRPSRQLSLF